MLEESDEFDLDVRLLGAPGSEPPLWAPGFGNLAPEDDGLQATQPDTSDTSCGFTCGCNTSETCTHACANPDAITFGYDCEDESGGECVPDPGGGGDDGDDGGDGDDD
jgi:hypothetical protein